MTWITCDQCFAPGADTLRLCIKHAAADAMAKALRRFTESGRCECGPGFIVDGGEFPPYTCEWCEATAVLATFQRP